MQVDMPDSVEALRVRCPACRKFFEVPASILPEAPVPAELPTELDNQEEALSTRGRSVSVVVAVVGAVVLLGALVVYLATRTGANADPQDDPVAAAPEAPSPKAKPPAKSKPKPTKRPVDADIDTAAVRPKSPVPDAHKTGPAAKPTPRTKSPEELFATAAPAVVRIEVRDAGFRQIGLGSAFFVSSDGLLVTNYHVIEKAKFASIRMGNKTTLFVEGIAAVNAKADLALLKVNVKDQAFLTLNSGQPPKVGVKVYAIGSPKGLENTFSDGMISGHRVLNGVKMIQISVPTSRGSSGGPLLTGDGKVVGVTTSGYLSGQNLNFAVQASQVAELVRNRGSKLQSLASAGGKRLDRSASEELDKVWKAMANKDWAAAAKILTPLRTTHKDNPVVWFSLGYLHGTLGNHEIAIQQYRRAIALQPNYTMAYYNIGINYGNLKQYSNAVAAYKRAIALRPDFAKAYYNTGFAHWSLEDYGEALAAFRKAVAIQPNYAEAHRAMGGVYRYMKQYRGALSAYKKALAITRKDAKVYCYMGWCHDYLNEHIEAIEVYQKAVAIDPDYAQAHYSMGLAYGRLSQDAKAIAAYRKAVAVKPDYAAAYYSMGVVYERIASTSDASRRVRAMQIRHKAGRRVDMVAFAKYLAEYRRQNDFAAAAYRQYIRLEPSGTLAASARAAIRRIQN
jgi:S1-C subfamily serine protease/Tfp pilus assembly protein PilF